MHYLLNIFIHNLCIDYNNIFFKIYRKTLLSSPIYYILFPIVKSYIVFPIVESYIVFLIVNAYIVFPIVESKN